MGDQNSIPAGQGRLLDAWEPPGDAGDPVGCIATTFTFSPAFFEEECLGRFLKVETAATEDGPVYLVEREEKLSQVACAAVLVDQHHCKGARSLRWDLHPVRPDRGILHAKISLLCWSRLVRLIIGSANLTEDGYRRNREVYGVVDFHEGSESPRPVLQEVLQYLRQTSDVAVADNESLPLQRMRRFLDRVQALSRSWGTTEDEHAREPVRVTTLLIGPGRPDLFTQLSSVWPGNSPPNSASVVSPFFDPSEAQTNKPAASLWNIMRKRGKTEVDYCVETEDHPNSKQLLARAPASLLATRPSRDSCSVAFSRLTTELERPLHAKQIWLKDERWMLFLIGSSNFTSAGTGVGKAINYEANLAYLVDRDRAPHGTYADFERRFPAIQSISDPETTLQFLPASDVGIDSAQETVLLPTGFLNAIYRTKNGREGEVLLTFGDDLPSGWRICDEQELTRVTEAEWHSVASPRSYSLIWEGRPPSGFLVTWDKAHGLAWWPINVASAGDLPPPDELRDLPLDVLIDILTSARPLHDIMRGYLRRKARERNTNSIAPIDLDPHKRVDTNGFLLQRTRRFSSALRGLRSRLERPVSSEECLEWRINGPVGIKAVAAALTREARSDDERVFLLAELALELTRVKPKGAPGALSAHEIREALHAVSQDLQQCLSLPDDRRQGHLAQYLDRVSQCLTRR
ncbi:MAG: hypothetical protein OJF47_002172 [Nitrospira sp.]|nr:MAG: hypothetical protein OJF47_002172 [Nitrospira sp.]